MKPIAKIAASHGKAVTKHRNSDEGIFSATAHATDSVTKVSTAMSRAEITTSSGSTAFSVALAMTAKIKAIITVNMMAPSHTGATGAKKCAKPVMTATMMDQR
ncbi:hypothetical protein IJG89_01915 [Candidatus Saccharibacteria bacterium]|nr:hypothetical protein [Candidatus Saccharibacteria bacterium]